MHVKNPFLFGLMAILLLGGTITPALSQSSNSNSIVINEVEINTFNGSEYVELYNTTSQSIDISGWSLVPSASWKNLQILPNTIIEPKSFLVFTHHSSWFKDFGDTISLKNSSGELIDETHLLIDLDDDAKSWQRSFDGLDTDSESDWELKRMSPKSSNGLVTAEVSDSSFILSIDIDKSNYTFGEYLTISGTVSEKLYVEKPYFVAEIITIHVSGPDYSKNIAIFPERNLEFSSTLSLQEVLGFKLGDYDVEVTYGENTATTNFTIDSELTSSSVSETEILEINTENDSYMPGDTVTLVASVNTSIEFGGLDYTVTNPNGKEIFSGTLFPNSKFSIVNKQGGGQILPFSTQLFMTTINPVYGTYVVEGVFKSQNSGTAYSQNTLSANTTFNLIEDVKEDAIISLSTDKSIYSVGDIVKVTGRSNDYWTETLALDVLQTGLLTIDSRSTGHISSPNPFKLNDSVRLNGDGTFEYEFKLVENSNSLDDDYSSLYGDYKITLSEYFGQTTVFFTVAENPDSFVDVRTPLGLISDKSEYVLGTKISFSGKISEYNPAGNQKTDYVQIKLYDPTGKLMMTEDRITNSNDYGKSPNTELTLHAKPDPLGVYGLSLVLVPIQFDYGVYTATAIHPVTKITESIQFEIKSAQDDIVPIADTTEPITLKLCKSDRQHVDEIIKDMKQIGRGEIPPSMESVDCSDNLSFKIGEKLIVKGKVIPKDPKSLASTYADRSSGSQTSDGHAYTTNYAVAEQNYVVVSIPYPYSMSISGAASVTTIPNADENYTGGGGQGKSGSSYYVDADGNVVRPDTHCEVSATQTCSKSQTRSDRSTGYDGTVIFKEQKLRLKDMNFKAYPDAEGNYVGVFELRAGVFKDGIYSVKANYFGYNAETSVEIVDNSLKGGLEPNITLSLNNDEFLPGDIVRINGNIENIYYYDPVSVIIETPDVSKINCLKGQQCGFGNTEKKLRVIEGVDGANFSWNYEIPSTTNALGEYKIIADTHFGQYEKQFFVVDESEIIGTPTPESAPTVSKKIIEKFNRIADDKIPIILTEKSTDDSTLAPRVIQGSLFTSARGEESDVNLRITTSSGQCVIGQSSDCLVTESTRKPGAIYSVVTIDDVNYKIRYSGDDVRLEKFSIVPEDSSSKIDIDNWNVEIIKDEQPSRFYYKVSYVALE